MKKNWNTNTGVAAPNIARFCVACVLLNVRARSSELAEGYSGAKPKPNNPLFSKGDILHIFLGFKNQKLVTVTYSVLDEVEDAIDCDYYITDPQDAEKQIAEWKKKHET